MNQSPTEIGSSLYFAYGSNLDPDQMRHRCPDAVAQGTALLPDWSFSIFERGYATIAEHISGAVYGGLWKVSEADLRALDRYEGVERDFYRRFRATVMTDTGAVQAWVYVADRSADGTPKPGYLERIIAGAEWFGIDADYVAMLSTWGA
jgi:gamma-glutamylcyclotransferase (GGCT)/AIG2-like uncharacterized protein YtfP